MFKSLIGILFLIIFFNTSCTQQMSGDVKVFNDSDTTIYVKYCQDKTSEPCDTVILIIEKGLHALLKNFSDKSNPANFSCCPCQTNIFQIRSVFGKIKKDPNNKDNWSIPNKSKLRRFNSEAVRCELHVEKSDL